MIIGPLGIEIAKDIGLIVAGTGLLKIGKDRLQNDGMELINQLTKPDEEVNVFEVNDFEITEF